MATYGPTQTSAPAGAIIVHPGDNVSAIVNGAPTGATFFFTAGTYHVSISPKDGQTFIGEKGAILDGSNSLTVAFAQSGASNVTIQNFVVTHYNNPAQTAAIGGGAYTGTANQGWHIVNNEVSWNLGVGIKAGSNSVVQGNYVHDQGELGLGGSGNNILIQGNEIAHNGGWAGVSVGFEGGGAKWSETNGLKVIGNYSHDNIGPGLWTDIDNINTTYDGNLIVHNTGSGISHEISYDATIKNNVFVNNAYQSSGWLWGSQIQIQNSKNVNVYNNEVDAGSGNSITLIQQNRGSGAYAAHTTTGNNLPDNTIIGGSGSDMGGAADWNSGTLFSSSNTWSNNHLEMADGSKFWWNNSTVNFSQFKSEVSGGVGALTGTTDNSASWVSAWNAAHGGSSASSGTGASTGTSGSGTTGSGTTGSGSTGTNGQTGSGAGTGTTDHSGGSTGTGSSGSSGSGSSGGTTGSGSTSGSTGSSSSDGSSSGHDGQSAGGGSSSSSGGSSSGTGGSSSGSGTTTGGQTSTGDIASTPQHLVGDKHANVLLGGTASDHLNGLGGSDQLFGHGGNDLMNGGNGNDMLFAGGGHGDVRGGSGQDVILDAIGSSVNGGNGADVVVLDGTLADYTVSYSHGAYTFTNAAGGTETVRSVEQFAFEGDGSTYTSKHHTLVQADLADAIAKLIVGIQPSAGDTSSSSTSAASATDSQLLEMQELDLASSTSTHAAAASNISAASAQAAAHLMSVLAHLDHNGTDLVHHTTTSDSLLG